MACNFAGGDEQAYENFRKIGKSELLDFFGDRGVSLATPTFLTCSHHVILLHSA